MCLYACMQHWIKLDHREGEPWPMRRAEHASVCLGFGGECPQLFVIGGLGDDGKVLGDGWMLDVQSGKWREVRACV